MILRLPKGARFEADEDLASEFLALSENRAIPNALRDFCMDLSLRARAVETGPLGISDPDALVEELKKRAASLRTKEGPAA